MMLLICLNREWIILEINIHGQQYIKEVHNIKGVVMYVFYDYYCGENKIQAGSIGIDCDRWTLILLIKINTRVFYYLK